MLKATDLREMESEELAEKERELSQQLFALRLQKVTGQLESPAKVKATKKDMARVLTVLNEKKKSAPSVTAAPSGVTATDDEAASPAGS
jgi:large subunit ribosomal protein L29